MQRGKQMRKLCVSSGSASSREKYCSSNLHSLDLQMHRLLGGLLPGCKISLGCAGADYLEIMSSKIDCGSMVDA